MCKVREDMRNETAKMVEEQTKVRDIIKLLPVC